jgi:hypothetical protein
MTELVDDASTTWWGGGMPMTPPDATLRASCFININTL